VIELSPAEAESSEDVLVSASLGEQLILWEVATVVASRLIGVNPFDQPDVESAKIAARAMLDSPAGQSVFAYEEDSISVATLGFSSTATDTKSSLDQLFEQIGPDGYVSIHCYLNRESMGEAETLRNLIAARTKRPTTFGWGPRFLHSTGQYHKGGPKQGVFLQIVSGSGEDLPIPGRGFGFRQLIDSQASGDARVLADNGSPVLVLQLSNPQQGIKRLIGMLS